MNYRALIISEKNFTRTQFRQLAINSEIFSLANAKSCLASAQETLSTDAPYDYIFLGSKLSSAATASFIEFSKSLTHSSKSTKIILIFEDDDQSEGSVAANMMVGVHGFICQPFCTESIREVAGLAQSVSEKHTALRLKAAAGLMLSDLRDEPDDPQADSTDLWQKAKNSCAWYNRVTTESLTKAVELRLHRQSLSDRITAFEKMRGRVVKMRGRLEGCGISNLPFFRRTKSGIKN